MHATLRRIKVQPGRVSEVARLIEQEYVPLIEGADGFVSYTLIDLGDDEIASTGIFRTAQDADQANRTAQAWTAERLAPLVASPLDVRAGAVLLDHRFS